MTDLLTSIYYDGILPNVQKPSRYIDCELNLASEGFREGRFNVLLVFPDVYGIGMSHQGIRFLYDKLASMKGVGVEFAFAPWPDMEQIMRGCGETFRSWQTGTPAVLFDLIGFSLTYELHYTNLLMILDLSGLSLEARRRRKKDPIVIAGGPCCTNPFPFLEAVDAVFLGDGEESLPEAVDELSELKKQGAGRRTFREALAGVEGVFVDGVTETAASRTYRFKDGDLPRLPIVPSARIVHDRLAVEVMRGCTRGCRFCQAGVIYRPCRERDVGEIVDAVCSGLDATGWDEVSLLSLSTSDYSSLGDLLKRLTPELEKRKVSLALPSLRPETITEQIVAASSMIRRSGFTLAPEAGTERLRRFINKGLSDDDILKGCLRILEGGWQSLKLYFMIGLPTECGDDMQGIVDLIYRILKLPRARGRFKLSVSVSPFVPKPHTPFQWERQCSMEEFYEKESFLSGRLRSRRIQLSLREPALSILEGIFSRGDRRLWPVLVTAYRLGCRFDGWRDRLRFDLWEEALGEHGLEISPLIGERSLDDPLPWKKLTHGVKQEYLLRERASAFSGVVTPDCRGGNCNGCGACEGKGDMPPRPDREGRGEKDVPPRLDGRFDSGSRMHAGSRYRFIYEKVGRCRFLAHLEILNLLQRALRRLGLPLKFTEGYHPHPRISSGPSLAVGMEGLAEFFDVELSGPSHISPEFFNNFLPDGIRVKGCMGPFSRGSARTPREALFIYRLSMFPLREVLRVLRAGDERLSKDGRMWYSLGKELGSPGWWGAVDDGCCVDPACWLEDRLRVMFNESVVVRDEKGRERSCRGCSVRSCDETEALEIVIPAGGEADVRPRDLLEAVLPEPLTALVRITRLEILYKTQSGFVDPLALIGRT